MNNERKTLKKYGIIANSFIKKNNAKIIITKDNKYIIKEKRTSKEDLFKYLSSRSFLYFPKIYNNDRNDEYEIYEYIEEVPTPKEQKAIDIINLASLLHNKTTHYKELDIEDYKIIYEDLKEQIADLKAYYTDINVLIDEEIYMSPSEYLLVRNISKIYASLEYVSYELDNWYELIKNKNKYRVVTLHNNLRLDHLISNQDNYLVSWDKSTIGNPIYDIYNFYINNYDDVDFSGLLRLYESKYPLTEDEHKLLFVLLSLPKKFEFVEEEYLNVRNVNKMINYMIKTDKLLSEYYTKQEHKEENNFAQ